MIGSVVRGKERCPVAVDVFSLSGTALPGKRSTLLPRELHVRVSGFDNLKIHRGTIRGNRR